MKAKGIIGIDLAGKSENPTGWALLRNKTVKTSLVRTDNEILEGIARSKPTLTAIDAPLSIPKSGLLRRADELMIEKGYRVFPPNLPSMRTLTLRAIELNTLIAEKGYKTLEVHPTSTRKALNMPSKDWKAIQKILRDIGLRGDLEIRRLSTHEIDAITAALTAFLYLMGQTEAVGDEAEGYIVVPKKQEWRTLKI